MLLRCLLFTLTLSLAAQAQDPFGGGAQPAAPAGKAAAAPAEIKITNPSVQTLLDSKPNSPSQWVSAINTLIDLKHAPVAKRFVTQLLAANLNEEQLAQLQREYGTATFLRIGGHPDLAPEGKQLADVVISAAVKQDQDPARLAQWISGLSDPSLQVRSRALAELRLGDSAAVLAMIAVLADAGRANEHAAVRNALATMRANALPPLVAVLESENAPLKVQAVDVLGRLGTADPAIYLLAPALAAGSPPELQAAAQQSLTRLMGRLPDLETAASMLYTRARTEYERSVLVRGDTEPRHIWRWDAATSLPVLQTYPPFMVALLDAVRLSKDLLALKPESPTVGRLYLASTLALSAHQAGRDEPLPTGPGTAHDLASAAGPHVVQQVLAHSLSSNHLAAATGAVQILGAIGNDELLNNRGAKPGLLVEATMHPDRRLRFAAVAAVMNLQPQRAFAGSSQVLKALVYFAGGSSQRRALVLDTHLNEATRLAGLLESTGFDQVDVTTQPRDFLERAATWPDYELALVDFNLPRTNVDELVQMLRHDHRSRAIPVLLVASTAEDQRSARYVAEHLPHVGVIVRPADASGMEVQVNAFMAKTQADVVPGELRLSQAKQSLEWLTQLARQAPPLFNVQRSAGAAEAALAVPELAPTAAALLADLGTEGSQQALLAIANRLNAPLELRQAAAAAFAHSVKRHGILLTSGEMAQQYDRYNASETEPPESQALLSSILDALEAHPRRGERS